MDAHAQAEFTLFFGTAEPRLRLALCGAFGSEPGREAAAEALTWGWQHWSRLHRMDNPIGYLYRVGRNVALRDVRRARPAVSEMSRLAWEMPEFEPGLARFVAALSEHQRVAVWMVHGLEYSHRDVAELLGCSRASVATHVRRALTKLRLDLEVTSDA
jgi:DNA-directed RNA polymerase specialized sigma24 family protein